MSEEKSSATKQREWDLVIYGATGDAGSAIAMYVANNVDNYKKNSSSSSNSSNDSNSSRFRWAIAGRSELKLNRLRSRIIVGRLRPSTNDEIGVLTADSASTEDMNELAKSTRVVVSAVGPYTSLGESIYSACAENGTNYVDITGEVDWVSDMRDKYQNRAKETGSTLCSFAGYDSIPCDITMYLAHKVLSENDANMSITSAETVVQLEGGSFPRGTIRTMISKLPGGAAFPKKLVQFVSSKDVQWKTALSLVRWLLPRWSPEFGAFTLPHFMGWCNIPVIYNSSSIDCTYHDRMAVPYSQGCLTTGYGLLQTLVLYSVLLMVTPWFLCFQIFVIFVPSTASVVLKLFDSFQYRGNTQRNQRLLDESTVDVWTYVTSSSGSKAKVHVHVNGDAGIKATALFAAETAFSVLVLQDKNELPRGVIGSPSMIVGDALVERLQDEAISDSCTLSVTIDYNENENENENENGTGNKKKN